MKNPNILRRLLQALALQIGQKVSYNELANLLGIDKATVSRYVALLRVRSGKTSSGQSDESSGRLE